MTFGLLAIRWFREQLYVGSRGEGLTLFVVYMFPIIKKDLNRLIIRDMVNESIKIRRKNITESLARMNILLSMKFIFLLPGKQDKTVRNRGLYNPHCLLRGNKAVCKRRVLFSWHRVAPWALTQHVTGQRTMRTMRREQEGQGDPFRGRAARGPARPQLCLPVRSLS